ncbi:MAG: EAL domain-containing protein [Porticoccaceae bacterium]|nr:EAL domain-containing protein [Porticoccaceae bacterium]
MKHDSGDKSAILSVSDPDDLMLTVINNQAQGIVVLDKHGNVVIWNNWMDDWTGIAGTRSVGRCFEALTPGIIGSEYTRTVRDAIDTGKSVVWSQDLDSQRLDMLEDAMTRGDRLLPLSRVSVAPLQVNGGQGCMLEFVEAAFNPIHLRDAGTPEPSSGKAIEQAPASDQFPVYLASSDAAMLSLDRSGIIRDVSDPLLKQTGYSRQQLLDTPVRMLFPTLSEHYDIEDYRALTEEHLRQSSDGVIEAATLNGQLRAFKITVYPSTIKDDLFVLMCEDFALQSGAQNTIKRQREMLAAVFGQVADGIALVDYDGLIEQINPVGLAMLGIRVGQEQGVPVETIIAMLDGRGKSINPSHEALSRGSVYTTPDDTFLQVQSREPIRISGTAIPLRDRDNDLTGCMLVYRIVEQARRVSSRLSWQSDHDPLTELPNRQFLENQLVKAIEAARNSDQTHVLLYIDLHNFSLVNDTGGRVAGDTLLLECGKLLQQVVGVDHLVARIGNDEFAVLLHDCMVEQAREIIEDLLVKIKAFSFPWQERRLKIGVNIGVEVIDHNTSSELDVLVSAASSCAAAKASGRNRVFFRQQRDEGLVSRKAGEWIPKISEALEQGRFRLHYQPIVAINGGVKEYSHFEALVRMVDESGQLVAPGEFIPAAELYGLIDDIDRWAVRQVITELSAKKLSKKPDLRIAVNLSGATISDERFKDDLLKWIDESKINPHQLQFEITETAAVRQFDRALDLIHALKAKGCYFSLDDFGSGLSSFAYLKELPVDFLKIDGGFVHNIELSDIDYSMTSTINHLAQVMGIATIAECVENQAQLTILEQIGVDYAQGFLIATPQPIEKLFP